MKQTFKQAFGIALLCSAVAISSLSAGPLESNVANFVPRSPGDYLFMEMGLGADKMHMKDKEEMYGNFSVNARYDRSFRGERITEGLFGSDSAGVLNFKGSAISGRSKTLDIVADNFGLGIAYDGKVTFDPQVTRFVADFNFHLGLDEWFEGLYFMVNAPLAYEKWEAKGAETNTTPSATAALNGYMAEADATSDVLTSLKTALLGATDFGDKTEDQKWQIITMDGDSSVDSSKFALADVDAQVGYNFIRKDDCVLGIFGNVVAPTGNEPDNKYAFEARVGNKNWQLGGGGHFYKNLHDKDDSSFAVRAGAKVVTGLKNKEKRTFDFVDYGKMSRYMLLKKFKADYTYDSAIVHGANVSTRDVDVKFDILADVFGQIEYRKDNYGFDAGYNF
ncbi:hypothetical protein HOL34_02580 [bacterium]|nr:hypothetical protein [bacterium]